MTVTYMIVLKEVNKKGVDPVEIKAVCNHGDDAYRLAKKALKNLESEPEETKKFVWVQVYYRGSELVDEFSAENLYV